MKQLIRLLVFFVCLGYTTTVASAEDCEAIVCSKPSTATASGQPATEEFKSCIERKKSCLENKITETQKQKNTLNSAISVISSKISIQEIQIIKIQAEINQLEREITALSELIGGLNLSLDRLSSLLVERVKEQYKQTRVSQFTQFLASESFGEFFGRQQYLQRTSDETALAMERAELKRIIYDQQKELKEKKQLEVEQKRMSLQREKNKLAQQKNEQQTLLAETKNSEALYQKLLTEAETQLAAFNAFTRNAGGPGIIPADGLGKGYDSNYFSQRDSRWGNNIIGNSKCSPTPCTITSVGCLITSVAMVLKSKGVNTIPSEIAANSQYFSVGTAMMKKRYTLDLPGGKRGVEIKKDVSSINAQLDDGNPVIVGIYVPNIAGTHFVVLKKREGNDWIMYDPWYGPDITFSSHYMISKIFSAEVIE